MGMKNNLKEIRLTEYLMDNMSEFAVKVLEMDYRQYHRYEHGTIPKLETALYIAKKLNKNVEDIFYLD